MDIHKLLDLPDSAATEILTLDFGAANEAGLRLVMMMLS